MLKACVGILFATIVASVVGCSSSSAEGFPPPPPEEEETSPAPKAAAKPSTPPAPPAPVSTNEPTTPPPPDEPDAGAPAPDSGAQCQDTSPEPASTEANAYALPAIDDCDGSAQTIRGVAAGMFDVDVYKFRGDDTYLCRMGPKASITAPGLRLCMFIQCQSGTTNIASCGAGTASLSKQGLKGCCVEGPAEMTLDFDCNGSADETSNFYLQVDQPKADLCVPYSVTYSL
jgi:hypothetical protein